MFSDVLRVVWAGARDRRLISLALLDGESDCVDSVITIAARRGRVKCE